MLKIVGVILVVMVLAVGARADWTEWAEFAYRYEDPTDPNNKIFGWFTNGTKGEVLDVIQQSATEYSVEFAGYWDDDDPPGDKPNAWWGWEGNHEWDRHPEPWGQKTYSFNMVGQSVGYGREAVVFHYNDHPGTDPTEIIWYFRIPIPAVGEVRLNSDFLRRIVVHARPNDGAQDWADVYIPDPNYHVQGEYNIDVPIPLEQLDAATPGELKFQLRYSALPPWNSGSTNSTNTIIATVPDPNSCETVNLYGFGLEADLDGNCQVDIADFGRFTSQWMDCVLPEDPCCSHPWEQP